MSSTLDMIRQMATLLVTETNKGWSFKVNKAIFLVLTWFILSFQQHDLVNDKITKSFDIILTRHTMIHLYTTDAMRVLKNFYDSGSR